MDKNTHAARLLAWYDTHKRSLPWRVDGAHPEPYRVYLSEIMLQQTVVKTVIPYFEKFMRLWPRVEDLAAAELDDVLRAWAGLGYYARARNMHACAEMVVQRHDGRFPEAEDELLALPGIGVYTAAAIRAIAFDQPATVVDGNVERVVARLFAITTPLPGAKPLIREKAASLTPQQRSGAYAQAMMDLGAMICTPKRPACNECPLAADCRARVEACAEALPARGAKKPKPLRSGVAFLAMRKDGAILLRKRPDRGLLAKMMEVPSTPWRETEEAGLSPVDHAPLTAKWQRVPGIVTHTFTHFQLELEVWAAEVESWAPVLTAADPDRCRWVPRRHLGSEALPGVMRKIITHGLAAQIKHFVEEI